MRKTCLIGPSARSGVPGGGLRASAGTSSRAALGVRRRRRRGLGKRRIPDSPRTIEGRYWKWLRMKLSESFGEFGFGPWGLGPTPSPFDATQARSPRRLADTETG